MTRRTLEENIHRVDDFMMMPRHTFDDVPEQVAAEIFLMHLDYYLGFYGWETDFTVFVPFEEYCDMYSWCLEYTLASVDIKNAYHGRYNGFDKQDVLFKSQYGDLVLRPTVYYENVIIINSFLIKYITKSTKGRPLESVFNYTSRYKILIKIKQ